MKRRAFFLLFALPALALARKGCDEGTGLCDDREFLTKWNNFADAGNAYAMGRKVGILDAKLREHLIHRWEDIRPCL